MADCTSLARLLSSATAITLRMLLSFTSETSSPASGGSMRRKACGSSTSRSTCAWLMPCASAASTCPRSTLSTAARTISVT